MLKNRILLSKMLLFTQNVAKKENRAIDEPT